MNQKDAFNYLNDNDGIWFLVDCYEAEHTLSLDDAINDLTIVCKNNGGTKDSNVVNKKIQFMMDYVTAVVVGCIMKDTGLSVSEAMKAFYNSEVFDRLCDMKPTFTVKAAAMFMISIKLRRNTAALCNWRYKVNFKEDHHAKAQRTAIS